MNKISAVSTFVVVTFGATWGASGLWAADAPPRLAGKWTLDASQSQTQLRPVASMTVEQTPGRFKFAQVDKDGLGAHSFQGECPVDGGEHATENGEDETIVCRWNGTVLVTEQRWSRGKQSRTTRLSLGPEGRLVQDIRTTGPDGEKTAHLVWVKREPIPADVAEALRVSAKDPAMIEAREAREAAAVQLAPPYATPSVDNHQQVVKNDRKNFLHSVEGFEVSLWAEGFTAPRYMVQGTHGEILLSDAGFDVNSSSPVKGQESKADGKVYAFAGGEPAQRKELISGLDRPSGIALWKDWLYVAEAESIKRYRYDGSAVTGKGEEIISLKGMDKGHWTRSLLFDRAGQKLYVGIGSEKNVAEGEDPRRAAINRYNPDGSGHEIYASGMRNPTVLRWYPDTDVLWAGVQERDELGDSLVPDYLTTVTPGAFYGWPWTYIGTHPDPRMKPAPAEMAQKTLEPDHLLGSHVSVLDVAFYRGDKFPGDFREGAFVTLHGSWNRSYRDGYVVRFIPFRNGEPSGLGYDFVAGWTDSKDEKTVLGRPSGVFQTSDGRLLVSDDGTGRIWQVRYKGDAR